MFLSSRLVRALFATACMLLPLAFVARPRPAAACGGCFHPAADQGASVVTDHRMAFKISTEETVLWDQVRYAGDPEEFAWVLPVTAGARVELAHDEWLAALDAATRSTVTGPEVYCNVQPASSTPPSSHASRRSAGGCGGPAGCAARAEADEGFATPPTGGTETVQFTSTDDVEVVSQDVVGPYQSVVIHPTDDGGVAAWLADNGFAIPDSVKPVIDAYGREHFDFVALRLRPGQGVRAMRPVRVVSPGADVTLPLRMVAAGVGARVGLTLWILAEGRYETASFPTAPVDLAKLAWDGAAGRSNLADLQRDALATYDGRAWISEAALRTRLVAGPPRAGNPAVYDAYMGACATKGPHAEPCDGRFLADAGSKDASDAGDAGGPDGAVTCTLTACEGFDDVAIAARGLHDGDVWITRLRADLPVSALGTDLVLRPSPSQLEDDPRRHTDAFTSDGFDPCNGRGRASAPSAPTAGTPASTDDERGACGVSAVTPEDTGTLFLAGATAFLAAAIARRKRR